MDFYPTISIELLNNALDFATSYVNITDDERQIIIHAKKSFLLNNEVQWTKKTSNNCFDVTHGSFDGAETCEIVGSFLLSTINKQYDSNFGLYRDDGLGVTKASPRQPE